MIALGMFQTGPLPRNPSHASLVSSVRSVRPGESFEVALRLQMQPGWHVYWKNPGESGLAPTVRWQLPQGWSAAPIQWPTPERLDSQGIVTYVYEHEALLLTRITTPKNASPSGNLIRATAKWLVCREGCIPVDAALSLSVSVGPHVADPLWAQRLVAEESRLPPEATDVEFEAKRNKDEVRVAIRARVSGDGTPAGHSYPHALPQHFAFYPADTAIEPSAAQVVSGSGSETVIRLRISSYAPPKIERLRGLLVTRNGEKWPQGAQSVAIDIPIQP